MFRGEYSNILLGFFSQKEQYPFLRKKAEEDLVYSKTQIVSKNHRALSELKKEKKAFNLIKLNSNGHIFLLY